MNQKDQFGMYNGIQRELLRQDNYESALKLAMEGWAKSEFYSQCEKAGAKVVGEHCDGSKVCELKFLNEDYLISHPSSEFRDKTSEKEIPLWEKIVILHYLANAKGTSRTGELISYQQVPDGRLYYSNFVKRTTGIMVPVFGNDGEKFLKSAFCLGAKRSELGEFAVEIPALPKVSYYFIMWVGDDEFPSDFNIVFDRSIMDYLPAEDITVLANMIAVKLVKLAVKS